jgi:hypothetical protein
MLCVIVISLARAAERRLKVSKHLRDLGYNFVLLDAIDHRDVVVSETGFNLERSKLELHGRPLSDGPGFMTAPEIATLMSHRKAWQFLHESGMKHAMIVEDDVHMLVPAGEAEQRLWPFFNAEPDFKMIQCSVANTDYEFVNENPVYSEMTSAPMGSFCSIYAAAYAKKLLLVSADLHIPGDVILRRETNRTRGLFHLHASLAGHCGGPSFIRERGGVSHDSEGQLR